MTKKEKIISVIKECTEQKKLCRCYFKYDRNYYNYFLLAFNAKFILAIEEDDFILDGFSIRKICDLKKAEIKYDFCCKIFDEIGILDNVAVPDIDLTDWKSIFVSLQKMEKNIIVEKESLSDDEWEFTIGRIEKVKEKSVYIRHFDADGIWQFEPQKIKYDDITSVTFNSRYVETFSKFISEYQPEKKA